MTPPTGARPTLGAWAIGFVGAFAVIGFVSFMRWALEIIGRIVS